MEYTRSVKGNRVRSGDIHRRQSRNAGYRGDRAIVGSIPDQVVGVFEKVEVPVRADLDHLRVRADGRPREIAEVPGAGNDLGGLRLSLNRADAKKENACEQASKWTHHRDLPVRPYDGPAAY